MYKVYIKSLYTPERIDVVRKNIRGIIDFFNTRGIYVIAQDYPESENNFLDSLEVGIIRCKKLGVAGSTNYFLDRLFQSNDDFAFCIDDDVVLRDNYGSKDFLDYLHTNTPDIDYCIFTNVAYDGFKRGNLEMRDLIENNFVFRASRGFIGLGCMRLVKNIKKFYDLEFHVDENNELHEDILLKAKFFANQLKVYHAPFFLYASVRNVTSTIDNRISEVNRERLRKSREYCYKSLGLFSDNPTYEIRKRYHYDHLNIPRPKKYTYTDYELDYKPRKRKQNECD